MHKPTVNGHGAVLHRSILYLPQVHPQCYEEEKLFWRLNSHTRVNVHLSSGISDSNEENLLFYKELG